MQSGYILQKTVSPTQEAVFCRGLTHRYPGAETDALQGVTLSVSAGEVIALLGHNGAGKSTLLRILSGSLIPSAGEVFVFGAKPGRQPQRVTHLVQRSALRWNFPISLRELVATGTYVRRGWFRGISQKDSQIVDQTISSLGLEALARRPISALSGGQQQRALLARALVHDAELFLLDEPFTAVDEETCRVLLDHFFELKKRGRTLVISTHDCDVLEPLQPRKIILRDGKIFYEAASR
jgi:ABC-type Mn2+/Zn2+ transport system ATPase subunit